LVAKQNCQTITLCLAIYWWGWAGLLGFDSTSRKFLA
jgi:hypothetical protein